MNFPVELDDWVENQKADEDEDVGRDMHGLQPFPPVPSVGRNATPQSRLGKEDKTLRNSQGSLEALDVLFSRYRHVLSLVAHRILGNHPEAEDAVQNCLLTVSNNVPEFEHEGAFRCWLVRVLIDEAVTILAKQSSTSRSEASSEATVRPNIRGKADTNGNVARSESRPGIGTGVSPLCWNKSRRGRIVANAAYDAISENGEV